ncbi:MAG: VWA domain-containing protein [Planctomycetes bacterium]|nr:VWA domain-containing protein [Planctomycetota bacterium]
MILRHKVPTIFNIYMLDVICCALGCVILLWQVAHQEAETQTDDARKAQAHFVKAQKDLLSASSDVTNLQAELADWQKNYHGLALSMAMTEKQRLDASALASSRQDSLDKTRSLLNLSEDQLKKLQKELEELLASEKKTKAELTGKIKLNAELLAKIAFSEKAIDKLKGEITLKQREIDANAKKFDDQIAALKLSDEQLRKLQKLLDTLKDENKDAKTKLKLTELQLTLRQQDLDRTQRELLDLAKLKDKAVSDVSSGAKDLTEARKLIDALKKDRNQWKEKGLSADAALGTLRLEKDKLNQRVVDLQAEVEQRFAGIPLTGENVLFLIDISGSMTMKDENTDDPDKWPFLCETLMKLMKSIPTMKNFQVILFSDKVSYLFEPTQDGPRKLAWYKYEGAKTAQVTRDALRRVKVAGGTNMHDAFEEAFRYRQIKLDTVYLFSDGLPNIGEGVPAAIRNPTEPQKSYYMSKFIRDKLKTDWNRPTVGKNDVRINAVGFFFESPDVGAFLWALAREHRGSFVGLR